jgi:hypothetical protein
MIINKSQVKSSRGGGHKTHGLSANEMTPNKRPPHSLSDNDMDPESARALSLRLLPGLLAFAQRKRWAAPRPVTPQELVQFQILVAAMIITATPGTQPSATARDNVPRREPNIFSTLRSLDKQMDNYENKELLVRAT